MKQVKRIVILALGGTVLAIGVALIVLPGPAFIVIPVGLTILAVEFGWARGRLTKTREVFRKRRATLCPREREGRQSTPRQVSGLRADPGRGANSLSQTLIH